MILRSKVTDYNLYRSHTIINRSHTIINRIVIHKIIYTGLGVPLAIHPSQDLVGAPHAAPFFTYLLHIPGFQLSIVEASLSARRPPTRSPSS